MDNAKDIVRAAMRENVSLVIDLYSPELINKSTWIRIVQETVDLLMYENKAYGLRHIFLEEAAEFIPQRLQPQHARVYASLERLARMGRNARLGYTLINQGAEEVNKAILEISEFSLLHRQVGKNSIASIQKWLELLQVDNVKQIIQTLPQLKHGECWAIGMRNKPQLIQVAPKKTFHPDPKKNPSAAEVKKSSVDVTNFVTKLNKQLQPKEVAKSSAVKINNAPSQKVIDENIALKSLTAAADNVHNKLQQKLTKLAIYVKKLSEILAVELDAKIEIKQPANSLPGLKDSPAPSALKYTAVITPNYIPPANKKLGKCPLQINLSITFLSSLTCSHSTLAALSFALSIPTFIEVYSATLSFKIDCG